MIKKILILSLILNLILGGMTVRIYNNWQLFKHKVVDNIPVKYLDKVYVGDFFEGFIKAIWRNQ